MDRLVGTWTLESSENFEEFLVALGKLLLNFNISMINFINNFEFRMQFYFKKSCHYY